MLPQGGSGDDDANDDEDDVIVLANVLVIVLAFAMCFLCGHGRTSRPQSFRPNGRPVGGKVLF